MGWFATESVHRRMDLEPNFRDPPGGNRGSIRSDRGPELPEEFFVNGRGGRLVVVGDAAVAHARPGGEDYAVGVLPGSLEHSLDSRFDSRLLLLPVRVLFGNV